MTAGPLPDSPKRSIPTMAPWSPNQPAAGAWRFSARKVPSLFLDPIAVTKDNMKETVIRDQWHPEAKVYAGAGKAQ